MTLYLSLRGAHTCLFFQTHTVDHYENFPVASVLLPRRLRRAVARIYWFARSADDFADEGEHPAEWRLEQLASYRRALDAIEQGRTLDSPAFRALGESIAEHRLPVQLFRDLISAFEQDVTVTRYEDFATLLDYCRRSANPVGRLLLALHHMTDARSLAESDCICTSLQLINFWQDVALDWRKQRIYLPQQDLQRFGVDERTLAEGAATPAFRALLAFQVDRARRMMLEGAPLARRAGGRFGYELRLVVLGGLCILERIERAEFDVFRARPTLGSRDWAVMLVRSLGYADSADRLRTADRA